MTAIDRTAYPRPGARLTREELGVRYDLTEAEIDFVRANARADTSRLLLAVLLKTRRDFGCFPAPRDIHAGIVAHVGAQLELSTLLAPADEFRHTSTLYRYHATIRARLRAVSYDDAAERLLTETILVAAETMSDPADLINRAIETLQSASIDLPAFSTLDRLAGRLRAEVHGHIFSRVAERLTGSDARALDALLMRRPDSPTTLFNRLKQVADGVYLAQGYAAFDFVLAAGGTSQAVLRSTLVLIRRPDGWRIAQHHFSTTPTVLPIPPASPNT